MLYISTNVSPCNMPMEAQKGGTGIVLPIFNLGVRWRWVVDDAVPQSLYPQERALVPTV